MADFDRIPFPGARETVVDAGYLAAGRHLIYGLVEVDVTEPRRLLRLLSEQEGRKVSFTAFIVASLARTIATMPEVQAYRDWRGRLVIFHDVDVVTLVEPEAGKVAIPHIVRAANRRTLLEISDEIRAVQARPKVEGQSGRLMDLAPRLPRFVRMFFYWLMKKDPQRFRQMMGTTIVTSVGMFGRGGGWGISFLPLHNLGLTVGGVAEKPAVRDGEVVVGEFLSLTFAFDHDVVDGAPATRFAGKLVACMEAGEVVGELVR